MLFFIGNGCPPDLIAKWVLTFQRWVSIPKEKREQGKLTSLCLARLLKPTSGQWSMAIFEWRKKRFKQAIIV